MPQDSGSARNTATVIFAATPSSEPVIPRVTTGLDRLLADPPANLRRSALGLILHQASVRFDLRRADELIIAHPDLEVRALFGPQHGVYGEKQDNMIESDSFVHARTGIPVYSLYGDVRKPTPAMLDGLDALLFDLQDVGVRVYTFVWTMTLAMEACRDAGVRFVVLDRPNPVTGLHSEGAVLDPAFRSFVGRFSIPLRHGLTAGELARLCNERFGIGCELDVVPCEGWSRGLWFDDTGLPFVYPSPNLPTLDSCTVYPGMVLIEGTNLSEGRGTTRPFELIGAPWLDADAFADTLNGVGLEGVTFRACAFEPTFQKHAGQVCHGVQVHVTDRDRYQPVRATLELLAAAQTHAPDDFGWRDPPYEYEHEKMPIDILWGSDALRLGIENGATAASLLADTVPALDAYREDIESVLLYGS